MLLFKRFPLAMKLLFRTEMLLGPVLMKRFPKLIWVWIGTVSAIMVNWLLVSFTYESASLYLVGLSFCLFVLSVIGLSLLVRQLQNLTGRVGDCGAQTIVPGHVAPMFIGVPSFRTRRIVLVLASVFAVSTFFVQLYGGTLSARFFTHVEALSLFFIGINLVSAVCVLFITLMGTRTVIDYTCMIFSQRLTAFEMSDANLEYAWFDFAADKHNPGVSKTQVLFGLILSLLSCLVGFCSISLVLLLFVPMALIYLRVLAGVKISLSPHLIVGYYAFSLFLVLAQWGYTSYFTFIRLNLDGSFLRTFLQMGNVINDFLCVVLLAILGWFVCEACNAVCGKPVVS